MNHPSSSHQSTPPCPPCDVPATEPCSASTQQPSENQTTEHHQPEALIVVGRVLRAHGVQGAMKIESYMNPADHIVSLSSFVIHDTTWAKWRSCRATGKDHLFLATLETIDTPEQLAGWQNALIYVSRQALPHDPEAIYWVDWIGRQVVDCHQVPVGCVAHVHDFGAGPVLELDDGRMISHRSLVDPSAPLLVLHFDQSHL